MLQNSVVIFFWNNKVEKLAIVVDCKNIEIQ